MKAGQAVLEALRAEGVEYTFGVVGSTTNSIVTEMRARSTFCVRARANNTSSGPS